MKTDPIYSGKAKDIFATSDDDQIVAVYKDQATAFNGGKKEQIAADEKKGSAMGKLWDKVTGKEKERQQTVQENTAQGDKASKDAAAIGSSIEQAQAMMNDVDARLQDLNDMRDQVQQMKQAAASAYAEHADVVDQVLHYAVEGVNVVKGLLAQQRQEEDKFEKAYNADCLMFAFCSCRMWIGTSGENF